MAHSPRASSNTSRAAAAARASSEFRNAFAICCCVIGAVCHCIRNASDGLAKQQKPEPAGADVERNRYQSWRNTFQSRSTRHTATGGEALSVPCWFPCAAQGIRHAATGKCPWSARDGGGGYALCTNSSLRRRTPNAAAAVVYLLVVSVPLTSAAHRYGKRTRVSRG